MNKLIKKIACAGIVLMFVLGAFTGCKSGKTGAENTVNLPAYTSVKDPDGNLAQNGKAGEIEYKILSKSSYGTYEKKRGYYVDQLEQLDSPYFIVTTAGSKSEDGTEINIVDLGMQDGKLVIVVEETVNSKDNSSIDGTPCCVLEVDHNHMPSEFLIVSTSANSAKTACRFR